MGTVCSVSFPSDVIFSRCLDYTVRRAKYVVELEDNLEKLQPELQRLVETRNDVMRRVMIAEQQQMKRTDQVEGWLSRVQVAEAQVGELLQVKSREIERLCLGGCCSKNCKSSYKFGKKVYKLLQDMATLKDDRAAFEALAEKVPEAAVDERPSEPTVGLQSTLEKVWRCLVEEQPGIIGLYGMGGVGKTTLLTQINNKLSDTHNDFNVVIWVVVSKDVQLEKIQEKIGKKIGLFDESWNSRCLDEKALDIFKILSNKKFVLLLDDIWQRVDLTKVGVPLPSSRVASKVIFTTRSLDVCGRMEAHKKFRVECLAEEEAWKLFQKKVGEDTLSSHLDILDMAKDVAKECDGLPLALITIGRAMSCKRTPEEWRDAIQVLRRSASEFSGMGEEVYPLLKFSYDSLPSDKTRSCLLYCCLFPEDYRMRKAELIDCWMAEGILDEDDKSGEQDQGYSIIGVLTRACLLEEDSLYEDRVNLHDVIRDMVLWIACVIEKEKENFLIRAGAGLIEAPKIEKWEEVRRISLMENRIENLLGSPRCPHLQTLFLNDNSLKVITSEFFGHMPSLKVLNLSGNPLTKLPLGIPNLASLTLFDLSATRIEELPIELKALINLRCLNLNYALNVCTIPRELISSFSKLQKLRMFYCGLNVSDEAVAEDSVLSCGSKFLVEELLGLKCLKELGIHLRSIHALQSLATSEIAWSCTKYLSLRFDDSDSLNVSSLSDLQQLNYLAIINCKYLEEFKIDHVTHQPYAWHNLHVIEITECSKLRDLTWVAYVPNLKRLAIGTCDELEEILSFEKLGKVPEIMGSLNPFANLRNLRLFDLPNLKSIYGKALTFSHLRTISVNKCPKLKKLPLDCNSAKECQISIYGEEDWCKELQWEDEATQNVFLPCLEPSKPTPNMDAWRSLQWLYFPKTFELPLETELYLRPIPLFFRRTQ